MKERDCNCKIVAFVEKPSGMHQKYAIECIGPNNICLEEEVWSGEGIDSVAGRLLRTEAEIYIPPNTKINAYIDANCRGCPLKKVSDE